MPTYTTGSAKQNLETKAVAVRTIFPDMPDFADRQWGVMTVNNGGHYATNEEVADWPDIVPDPDWSAPSAEPEVVEPEPIPEDTVIVSNPESPLADAPDLSGPQ